MTRRVGTWVLAAVIVGVAIWGLRSAFGDASQIEIIEVRTGDLAIEIAVDGTLASEDSSILTPPEVADAFAFQIAFMAPEGSQVEVGDPVLAFDVSALNQSLETQLADLEQTIKNIERHDVDLEQRTLDLELRLAEAEASLARAELRNEIPDDLRAANEAIIAQLDVDGAAAEVESLRSQLQAARDEGLSRRAGLVAQRERSAARVARLEDSIARMTLAAPRAGTVIYVSDWRGEKKKVGDSSWRREKIIELPDLSRMIARGEVDEADAGRLANGQAVRFRLDAHPDIEFEGTIASIWRTVERKQGSRNPLKVVRVNITLAATDRERMRPGMRFSGVIEEDRLEDAVLVPSRVVSVTDAGPVVYRRSGFGWDAVPVTLGARNGDLVQVVAGLQPGDRVAAEPPA